MLFNLSRIDVWTASVEDQPGAMGRKLQGLVKAGANLELITTRSEPKRPGGFSIEVAPLRTAAEQKAAMESGFELVRDVFTLRLEGPDQPGLGYLVARAVGSAGVSMQGLSAATLGSRCIMYLTFRSMPDLERAIAKLNAPL